jgi:hypothetical protein
MFSLILHVEGRLALMVHGPERWQATPGYTMIPVEFPATVLETGETLTEAATALGIRGFGRPVGIVSSEATYGSSATRRIARLDIPSGEAPVPLLLVERMAPEEHDDGVVLRPVHVRAYLAGIADGADPHPELGGMLWLPPEALRAAVRGLPFSELLALEGVRWQPSEDWPLPENAFVYVPSEYGERFLLRALAKYGPHAVLQGENNGVGF